MPNATADIGVIGLAVMGQNLILNMNDHGYVVCAFNRTVEKVDRFLENEAKGTKIIGAHSTEEFVSHLKKPRRIMLMVKAGSAVDDFIQGLLPYLEKGDIIIDGGNSHFPDTIRRCKELEFQGFAFVGAGVSGGEEGARYGPSIMPGGTPSAWPPLKSIFQDISAKAGGLPCCDWVGESGAGHFVKMVHNGIEYGDMQLIAEAYHVMRDGLDMSAEEMATTFTEWNQSELDSYLIEITRDILSYKDSVTKRPLIDNIRDQAGQKGTGKWTASAALDYGIPVTLIGEAVFARALSSCKAERVKASTILKPPANTKFTGNKKEFLKALQHALYASKIISYTQGFMLLREASKNNKWNLNYGAIALSWRGGCIIRSVFLDDARSAFQKNPQLDSLLFDDFFRNAIERCQGGWRKTVSVMVELGIPTPAIGCALAFYDGYRTAKLPANLIQAQRDFFGAHTYQTIDNDEWVHTNWTGKGGTISSSTYNA